MQVCEQHLVCAKPVVLLNGSKDQRIAALEADVADLRASLHSIFESSLASIRSQDACVATIADLNLALQEELSDAHEIIGAACEELRLTTNALKPLSCSCWQPPTLPSVVEINLFLVNLDIR